MIRILIFCLKHSFPRMELRPPVFFFCQKSLKLFCGSSQISSQQQNGYSMERVLPGLLCYMVNAIILLILKGNCLWVFFLAGKKPWFRTRLAPRAVSIWLCFWVVSVTYEAALIESKWSPSVDACQYLIDLRLLQWNYWFNPGEADQRGKRIGRALHCSGHYREAFITVSPFLRTLER